MDFYALQLSPRKKDKEKEKTSLPSKIDAHLITKDELIEDLKKNSKLKSFVQSFGKKKDSVNVKAEENIEVEQKQLNPDAKATPIGAAQQIRSAEPIAALPAEHAEETSVKKIKHKRKLKSPFLGSMHTKGKVKSSVESIEEIKTSVPEPEAACSGFPDTAAGVKICSPNFNELEMDFVNDEPNINLTENTNLTAQEKDLLTNLLEACQNSDEFALNCALEQIASFRQSDEKILAENSNFNLVLKQQLMQTLASRLAHGTIKNLLELLQLFDTLGLALSAKDFATVPKQLLETTELKNAAIKFLQWYADEYEVFPQQIENQIRCFVEAGIISSDWLTSNDQLQKIIHRNLFDYFRDHQKAPDQIQRKIFQYSLTGFIDVKSFTHNEQLKDFSINFLRSWIEKHFDKVEEVGKKIAEYEKAGFLVRSDLKNDARIQRLLESKLNHYLKQNTGHPRKISMRIADYYNLGLISAQAREDFLRKIR